jgi:uncharacterized membrane protein YkoI
MKKLRYFGCLLLTLVCSTVLASELSKQQIAELVTNQFQGKVIAINEQQQDGKTIYQVKLLTKKGRVKVIKIDADTGKIIRN